MTSSCAARDGGRFDRLRQRVRLERLLQRRRAGDTVPARRAGRSRWRTRTAARAATSTSTTGEIGSPLRLTSRMATSNSACFASAIASSIRPASPASVWPRSSSMSWSSMRIINSSSTTRTRLRPADCLAHPGNPHVPAHVKLYVRRSQLPQQSNLGRVDRQHTRNASITRWACDLFRLPVTLWSRDACDTRAAVAQNARTQPPREGSGVTVTGYQSGRRGTHGVSACAAPARHQRSSGACAPWTRCRASISSPRSSPTAPMPTRRCRSPADRPSASPTSSPI